MYLFDLFEVKTTTFRYVSRLAAISISLIGHVQTQTRRAQLKRRAAVMHVVIKPAIISPITAAVRWTTYSIWCTN